MGAPPWSLTKPAIRPGAMIGAAPVIMMVSVLSMMAPNARRKVVADILSSEGGVVLPNSAGRWWEVAGMHTPFRGVQGGGTGASPVPLSGQGRVPRTPYCRVSDRDVALQTMPLQKRALEGRRLM